MFENNPSSLTEALLFTHRFHSMSDAHNELAVFLHFIDKLHWQHAAVKRLAELLSSCVQGTSKTITLEKTQSHRSSDFTDTLLMSTLLVCECVVILRW